MVQIEQNRSTTCEKCLNDRRLGRCCSIVHIIECLIWGFQGFGFAPNRYRRGDDLPSTDTASISFKFSKFKNVAGKSATIERTFGRCHPREFLRQHSLLEKIEDLLRIPGKDEFRLNDIWVSCYYLCFVERPTRLSKVFTKEKV